MRKIAITMFILQILLMFAGIWQITRGLINMGLFNIVLNLTFGIFNYINNIKK